MKLLVLFFVAAVWLQLPADGEAGKLLSTDFSRFINKRASIFSSEESNESSAESQYISDDDSAEPIFVASDIVKIGLDRMFSHPSWRELLIGIAPEEVMAIPEFRARWKVTEVDDAITAMDENFSKEDYEKITEVLSSGNWKGIIALSSSKAELTNQVFRDAWGLGELSDNVEESDEDGNFFQGPQWYEFLQQTELEVDEDANDWQKASILMEKISDIGSMMQSIDSD